MTTPTDPDRDGPIDDLPYLPPPRTGLPNDPTATLPATEPSAPDPATTDHAAADSPITRAFNVRELVESQRTRTSSPAYGSLPTATAEGVEAARALRAKAERKRRRNARLGWIMATILVGAAGVTGLLFYRAFQNEPDERAAAVPTGTDVDTVDGTDGSQSSSSGGLGKAIADARGVLGGSSGSSGSSAPDGTATRPDPTTVPAADPIIDYDTVPRDQTGPPPRIANRPEFRTVLYDLRVYDGVESEAPYRNYEVTYDTLTDEYFGFITDSATGESELVAFSGAWRYSVGPDGVDRRVRRSKLSANTAPDTPLAILLGETDVLPLEARPYATFVDERVETVAGIDGTTPTTYSYRLNVDAFRAANPKAYETWRRLWTTARHDNVDLVVPGSEQVRLSEVATPNDLRGREQADLSGFELTPTDRQAVVAFTVTERGIIDSATVVSPGDDVRIVYIAHEINDEAAGLAFPDDGWVDAPG